MLGYYLVCGLCLQALGTNASLATTRQVWCPIGRVAGSARDVGLPASRALTNAVSMPHI